MPTQELKPVQSGIPSDWLLNALARDGISLTMICKVLGFEETLFNNKRCILPVQTFNDIFDWSAKHLNNPDMGLQLSQNIDPTDFGLVGYLVSNSATLEDWLDLFQRYHCIFTPEYAYRVCISGSACRIYYQEADIPGSETRQDIDFSLGSISRPMKVFIQAGWVPDKASLTYARPNNLRALQQIFGSNLSFNQAYNFIEFPTACLSARNEYADPKLLEILKIQANYLLDQVQQEQSLIDKVQLLVTTNLGNPALSTDSIAAQLHMSVRNLHRQLREQGTSFQALRDDALLKLAKESLSGSCASITDIALKLGYSEASSFVRVFKRLQGITPLQFRKQHQR